MRLVGSTAWKIPFRFGLGLVAIALVIPTVASARQDELAPIRGATAKFHSVEGATAAGYELGYVNGSGARIITGCIAHPTLGAMGYHYFNRALIDDLVVDVLKPEGLVYAPAPDGGLKLVAVEYVVPGPNSNPPGVATPPTVMGMPMHILVPAVGFYIHHAWIWSHNPSGVFADWNPNVSCVSTASAPSQGLAAGSADARLASAGVQCSIRRV